MIGYTTLLASLVTLLTGTVHAQTTWPALLLKTKMQALFSYWLLFLTVIVEIVLLRILLRSESFLKIVITVIFMNQASAMLSMGVLLGVDAVLGFLQHQYMFYFIHPEQLSTLQEGIFNALYIIVIYITSMFMNATIEWGIAQMYFPKVDTKKLFWGLVLINGISIGIGIVGLLAYEHWFGVIKVKATL